MRAPAGTLSFQEAAKALYSHGVETGPVRLFEQLRERRILMADNIPYQEYLQRGWFRVETGSFKHPVTMEDHVYSRPFITAKGLQALDKIFARRRIAAPSPDFAPDGGLNLPECQLGF